VKRPRNFLVIAIDRPQECHAKLIDGLAAFALFPRFGFLPRPRWQQQDVHLGRDLPSNLFGALPATR
jgi:hypothetical protein